MKGIYFAENLKRYREKNNLNKEELGLKLGVTGATVGLWESKKNEPRMGKVQYIAEVLNVDVSELLFNEPPLLDRIASTHELSELKRRGVSAIINMPEDELALLLPLLERAAAEQ